MEWLNGSCTFAMRPTDLSGRHTFKCLHLAATPGKADIRGWGVPTPNINPKQLNASRTLARPAQSCYYRHMHFPNYATLLDELLHRVPQETETMCHIWLHAVTVCIHSVYNSCDIWCNFPHDPAMKSDGMLQNVTLFRDQLPAVSAQGPSKTGDRLCSLMAC